MCALSLSLVCIVFLCACMHTQCSMHAQSRSCMHAYAMFVACKRIAVVAVVAMPGARCRRRHSATTLILSVSDAGVHVCKAMIV